MSNRDDGSRHSNPDTRHVSNEDDKRDGDILRNIRLLTTDKSKKPARNIHVLRDREIG